MFNDILQDERERYTHVLVPVQRGFEIHVFYVGTCETGTLCADGAIPKKFGGDHVCGTRCELKRVVDEVAADRDSYPVRIFLLGPMVNDDSRVCHGAICWYQSDCIAREKKDGVSAFCKTHLALCKPMEFLAHCWNPEVFENGVMLQLFILCNGFLCHGMDDTEAMLLDVDDGTRPLRAGSNLECFESHDVVHGLE